MNLTQPKENERISPILVFFMIHAMQVGVGILGFQKYAAESAEQDAWIAVLLDGLSVHVLLWMIYKILERGKDHLLSIHRDVFGKKIGWVFNFFTLLYVLFYIFVVFRTYIEVVQVWMFPQLSAWWFGLVFLLVIYYFVSGGFKVVAGIALFSVVWPKFLYFF